MDELASAAPNLFLCLLFLIAAATPSLFGLGLITYLLILLQVEFFVIHSAANLGVILESRLGSIFKLLLVLFFSGLYLGLIWLAVSKYGVTWPLWAFTGLTITRLAGLYIGSESEGREAVIKRGWTVACITYIGLLVYAMPFFTDSGSRAIPNPELAGKAPWSDQANLAIVFGFLYFAITGVSALFDHAWLEKIWWPSRMKPDRDLDHE